MLCARLRSAFVWDYRWYLSAIIFRTVVLLFIYLIPARHANETTVLFFKIVLYIRFTYTHTQKPCTHVAVHPSKQCQQYINSTPPPFPPHNPCPFQMTNVKMMVVITAWLAVVSGVYCETNKDELQ